MQFAAVADYRGMTVAEITDMRAKMREHGAEVIVAKNTLLRLAARETGREALEPLLEGPTAIAFIYDDIAKAVKALNEYIKSSKKITVRGGLLGSSLIPADGLEDVTRMPSRADVMAEILGGLQAPLSAVVGLVNVPVVDVVSSLSGPMTDVVSMVGAPATDVMSVLQARINQLQAEEAAPAA